MEYAPTDENYQEILGKLSDLIREDLAKLSIKADPADNKSRLENLKKNFGFLENLLHFYLPYEIALDPRFIGLFPAISEEISQKRMRSTPKRKNSSQTRLF